MLATLLYHYATLEMSARPLARRETRDGRTLRYFDDRFWNAERAHLSDQLRMLQDFVNTRGLFDFFLMFLFHRSNLYRRS